MKPEQTYNRIVKPGGAALLAVTLALCLWGVSQTSLADWRFVEAPWQCYAALAFMVLTIGADVSLVSYDAQTISSWLRGVPKIMKYVLTFVLAVTIFALYGPVGFCLAAIVFVWTHLWGDF